MTRSRSVLGDEHVVRRGEGADALTSRRIDLLDRGLHAVKGKSAVTQVFGVETNDYVSE
jgi:hypothetical protein